MTKVTLDQPLQRPDISDVEIIACQIETIGHDKIRNISIHYKAGGEAQTLEIPRSELAGEMLRDAPGVIRRFVKIDIVEKVEAQVEATTVTPIEPIEQPIIPKK